MNLKLSKRSSMNLLNLIIFRGDGWKEHTVLDHNVWAYVYFILYLEDKPRSECNGVEKYVKDQLAER